MQMYAVESWLVCPLKYSNAIWLTVTAGRPAGLQHPSLLEAMALILDLVTSILVELHHDPLQTALLHALRQTPATGYQLGVAVARLAEAAKIRMPAAREVLEEVLLQQGMLLRWLGGLGASFLQPDTAVGLVEMASRMLLKQPNIEGQKALAVEGELASQVNGGCGL